jgi:hypothetical protein
VHEVEFLQLPYAKSAIDVAWNFCKETRKNMDGGKGLREKKYQGV